METLYFKKLTQEEMDNMKALQNKFTFNDLRLFLKARKLDLVIGKTGELLDYDLFFWHQGVPNEFYENSAKTFSATDSLKIAGLKRALEDLVTTKKKAWRTFPGVDKINQQTQKVSAFAESLEMKLDKCIKLFMKNDEELLDAIEAYGLCKVVFTADSLVVLNFSREVIADYSVAWQTYLGKLMTRETPKFKHGQIDFSIED